MDSDVALLKGIAKVSIGTGCSVLYLECLITLWRREILLRCRLREGELWRRPSERRKGEGQSEKCGRERREEGQRGNKGDCVW